MSAIKPNTLNVLKPQGTLPGELLLSFLVSADIVQALFHTYCAFSRFTAWPIALNSKVFLLRRYLENEETHTGHTQFKNS